VCVVGLLLRIDNVALLIGSRYQLRNVCANTPTHAEPHELDLVDLVDVADRVEFALAYTAESCE